VKKNAYRTSKQTLNKVENEKSNLARLLSCENSKTVTLTQREKTKRPLKLGHNCKDL
jgi:hypothetical protein